MEERADRSSASPCPRPVTQNAASRAPSSEDLPRTAKRDIRIGAGFAQTTLVNALGNSLAQRLHRVGMARDEHAPDGKQIARKEDQDELRSAILELAYAPCPPLAHAIDVVMIRIGAD